MTEGHSPYDGLREEEWPAKTKEIVEKHPLEMEELLEIVQESWNAIFSSKIGSKGFMIGKDILPKPQIMSFFLHELIPLELAARYPGVWRGEESASDKDMVYVPGAKYSIEIKASSHKKQIFGNRSYAQKTKSQKKSKSGYYLALNFEKFSASGENPRLRLVRFGWLDHSDWQGQKAASGQQARLPPAVENGKLLTSLQRRSCRIDRPARLCVASSESKRPAVLRLSGRTSRRSQTRAQVDCFAVRLLPSIRIP